MYIHTNMGQANNYRFVKNGSCWRLMGPYGRRLMRDPFIESFHPNNCFTWVWQPAGFCEKPTLGKHKGWTMCERGSNIITTTEGVFSWQGTGYVPYPIIVQIYTTCSCVIVVVYPPIALPVSFIQRHSFMPSIYHASIPSPIQRLSIQWLNYLCLNDSILLGAVMFRDMVYKP